MIPRLLLIVGLLLAQPALAAACASGKDAASCCCSQPAASSDCQMHCADEEASREPEATAPLRKDPVTLAALPVHTSALLCDFSGLAPGASGRTVSSHAPLRRYLLACVFRL